MKVIETKQDEYGVYQPTRIVEREIIGVEPRAKKRVAPKGRVEKATTPNNPVQDFIGILQGFANTANAINKLMKK